jgi:beta-1,4-N-acetylglucosaminyltransferase
MNNKSEDIIVEFNNIEEGKKYNLSYDIIGDNVKTRLVKVVRIGKNIISKTVKKFDTNTVNYNFNGEKAELYYLAVITDEKYNSFSIGNMYLSNENIKEKYNLDYLILPYNYIEQIKQIKHDKGSINGRKEIYKDSINIIKTNLLFGHGYGYFKKMSIENEYSHLAYEEHSEVLKILVEIGLIGFIIIFYIVIKCVLILFRTINEEKGIFYLCILLSLLFCGTFDFVLSNYSIFLILIMIISLIFSNYNNIKKNRVIFISSAGGHLTEILKLKSIFKKYNSVLITEKNGIELNLDIETKYLIYCSRFYFFRYIFIAPINIIKSLYYFIKYNPDLIVTFGAHTSVPLCYFAWFFERKVIFIEVFDKIYTPTLSGILVYPIADKFIVQHSSLKKVYKKSIYIHGGYL